MFPADFKLGASLVRPDPESGIVPVDVARRGAGSPRPDRSAIFASINPIRGAVMSTISRQRVQRPVVRRCALVLLVSQ
jgi:hypothetical protein